MIEENSGPAKSVPLSEVSHLVSVPLSEVLLYAHTLRKIAIRNHQDDRPLYM